LNTIDRLAGSFAGSGSWHDAVGTSAAYTIQHTNRETGDGFDVAFKHDFEDGTVVDARFSMTWIAPGIFRVDVAGTPVGNGYLFEGYCHYHMKFGEKFVEASYRLTDSGLEVFGSSTTNAEGHYIAWKERLRRTA
jgi:hypothetical protein